MTTARTAVGLTALLLIMASGCDRPPPPVIGCGFVRTQAIHETDSPTYDAVAIGTDGSDLIFAWSEQSGTFWVRGRGDDHELTSAQRIGRRCAGGLALSDSGSPPQLACARHPDVDRGRDGAIVLYALDAEATVIDHTGPVGDGSEGIDLIRRDNTTYVSWRDASAFRASAWITQLQQDEFSSPTRLSDPERLASAPALAIQDGHLFAAWTESWLNEAGDEEGLIFTREDEGGARASLPVSTIDARPDLVWTGEHWVLAIRDRRRSRVLRTYVGRLNRDLRLEPETITSPNRNNSPRGRAQLLRCGGELFSIATRRSSRRRHMVSIQRLNDALENVGPEHQIYQYHAAFVRVAATCQANHPVLLVGERQSRVQRTPRLRAFTMHCGLGVENERTPFVHTHMEAAKRRWR